jgi:hypothetical protein
LVKKHCKGSYPIYRNRHYKFERQPIDVKLYWRSSNQDDIQFNKLLTLTPRSAGTLSLYIEYKPSDLDSLFLGRQSGLIIAPNKNLDVFKASFVSPNEFKLNALDYKTIDTHFSFPKKLSPLPDTFRASEDIKLLDESLFDIAMVNINIHKNGRIEPVRRKHDSEKNELTAECNKHYQTLANPGSYLLNKIEH